MSTRVGWETKIVFNSEGIPQFPQTKYFSNNSKQVKIYLPPTVTNHTKVIIVHLYLTKQTIPKTVIKLTGLKSATDFNCFDFDVTNVFNPNWNFRTLLGLSKVVVTDLDNMETIFESKSFRLPISEEGDCSCTYMKTQ